MAEGIETLPYEQRADFITRFAATNDTGMRRELLTGLIAPDNAGFFTSVGPMFRYAIFGRDSVKMASHLLPLGKRHGPEEEPDQFETLSRNVILTLARLQGTKTDTRYSEEHPGKIHHEARNRLVNGKPVEQSVQEIISLLRNEKQWMPPESDENELCYYGSVDATPPYVCLVRDHVVRFGKEVLAEEVEGRDGASKTIASSLEQAANYLYDEIGRSKSGLLEFKRTNPNGLVSQSWKDSPGGFLHQDGSQANYEGGVAAIDVQGYVYDALIAAFTLLPGQPGASDWFRRAKDLQRRTVKQLWVPELKYFAQGLDYDDAGQTRQIRTITSDPAVLLGTGLLEDSRYKAMRTELIGAMLGSEFLTETGIRLRALGHVALESKLEYHGSRVSWPKETSDIIRGLERSLHFSSASLMGKCLVKACCRSGDFYEFYKVAGDGAVQYRYGSDGAELPNFEGGDAKDPQSWQGWTVTAFLRAVHRLQENAA